MTPEKLRKMADGYQKKADKYWEDYQIDGAARSKSAYDRNTDLAEALYAAADARELSARLSGLRNRVLSLDGMGDVRWLQERIEEGEY